MGLLILLTNLQAGNETSRLSIAIEVPFLILQTITYISVCCLTRMHQARSMPQPSYCVPLFVYFSLFVRLSVVLAYPYLATTYELSMIVLFAFMAIILMHRKRVQVAMQRILFDQLIQQSEKAAGPILDQHQEGAR